MWSTDLILPGILLCCLAIPLLLVRSLGRKPKLNLPTGPLGQPFIGNLHQLGKISHRSLHRLANNYGPIIYLKLGSIHALVVSIADVAEKIHRFHDSAFCSGPPAPSPTVSPTGARRCLRLLRRGLAPVPQDQHDQAVQQKRIQSFRRIREEEVQVLVKTITEISAEGQLPNIICRHAFGRRSSKDGECLRSKFHDQLREFTKLFATFCPSDFFPTMGGSTGSPGSTVTSRRLSVFSTTSSRKRSRTTWSATTKMTETSWASSFACRKIPPSGLA